MKKIASLIALVVAISITGLTGCGLISKTPEGEAKTVVAKVGSEKLTKAVFDKRMQSIIGYYESYYGKDFFKKPENAEALKQVKEQALNNIADEMLELQKAKELKLDADTAAISAEVDKQYKEEVDNAGGEDKLKTNMEAINMTLDDLKENMRKQVIIGKLYDYAVKDVTVTDEEMKKYYQENLYDYTEKPNVMNLSHIVVQTEQEALKIKEEYNSGKKFEDLAKQYGTDATKDLGGLLGDIAYNDTNIDKTFLNYAKLVPEGKVSQPVQTQDGWHLIKVNKRTEYPAKPFEQVKEDIKSKMLEQKKQEKYTTTIADWKKKASIKVYTDRI